MIICCCYIWIKEKKYKLTNKSVHAKSFNIQRWNVKGNTFYFREVINHSFWLNNNFLFWGRIQNFIPKSNTFKTFSRKIFDNYTLFITIYTRIDLQRIISLFFLKKYFLLFLLRFSLFFFSYLWIFSFFGFFMISISLLFTAVRAINIEMNNIFLKIALKAIGFIKSKLKIKNKHFGSIDGIVFEILVKLSSLILFLKLYLTKEMLSAWRLYIYFVDSPKFLSHFLELLFLFLNRIFVNFRLDVDNIHFVSHFELKDPIDVYIL